MISPRLTLLFKVLQGAQAGLCVGQCFFFKKSFSMMDFVNDFVNVNSSDFHEHKFFSSMMDFLTERQCSPDGLWSSRRHCRTRCTSGWPPPRTPCTSASWTARASLLSSTDVWLGFLRIALLVLSAVCARIEIAAFSSPPRWTVPGCRLLLLCSVTIGTQLERLSKHFYWKATFRVNK